MHLIVQKIAFVHFTVGPNQASFARFLVMQPRSFVGLLPFPTVLSLTLQFIVHEFSLVITSIFKLELTEAVFFALAPHSIVSFAISEDFRSFSLLMTIEPAAIVDRSIVGIVLTLSKRLVILK